MVHAHVVLYFLHFALLVRLCVMLLPALLGGRLRGRGSRIGELTQDFRRNFLGFGTQCAGGGQLPSDAFQLPDIVRFAHRDEHLPAAIACLRLEG